MIFRFDSPDLEKLLTDLTQAPVRIGPAVRAVVNRGAFNIKNDARARFEDQRVGDYLPHYSRAITYDVSIVGHTVSAQVGSEVDKVQGPFGPGIEYGSVNHAPMPHLNPALDAEAPRLVAQIGDAAVRVLS